MKIMKKISVVLVALIAVYASFVAVDCVRLKSAPTGTKPIVTVDEEETPNREKYMGLGYSVLYHTDRITDESGKVTKDFYGAEFWLFDKILIWGWVE